MSAEHDRHCAQPPNEPLCACEDGCCASPTGACICKICDPELCGMHHGPPAA